MWRDRYDARANVYPRKPRPDQKIDAAVVLMMAIGRAMLIDEEARSLKGSLTNPIWVARVRGDVDNARTQTTAGASAAKPWIYSIRQKCPDRQAVTYRGVLPSACIVSTLSISAFAGCTQVCACSFRHNECQS